MGLRSFRSVMRGLLVMSVGNMRVVRGLLMLSLFMMGCCLAVMVGCTLVMLSGFRMVFMFRHRSLSRVSVGEFSGGSRLQLSLMSTCDSFVKKR